MSEKIQRTPINSRSRTLGVKGFDKDLKCRSFQYQIGKVYEMNTRPRLCGQSFHYCQTISDVFYFYPNNGDNRYY